MIGNDLFGNPNPMFLPPIQPELFGPVTGMGFNLGEMGQPVAPVTSQPQIENPFSQHILLEQIARPGGL